MSLTVWDWRQQGEVSIPHRIERRYCPTDMGHWRVDAKRCPVCKAKIAVGVYVLGGLIDAETAHMAAHDQRKNNA